MKTDLKSERSFRHFGVRVSWFGYVSCEYKAITTFADQVSIEISVKSVKLSKLSFLYRMVNQDCILVCTTVSEHSFLSKEASFVNLKNDYPAFFKFLKEQSIL